MDAIGALVALYCGWLLGNAIFVTQVYSAESLYQPLMLLGGFAATATLERPGLDRLFRFGAALVAAMVLHGLLQHFGGVWYMHDIRASGPLMTPNSLGTAINFFLAPAVALYLMRGSRRVLALALWLFAGLAATESRGAMLAFFMGLGFVGLALASVLQRALPRVGALVVGLVLTWFSVDLLKSLLLPTLFSLFRGAGGEQGAGVAVWFERAVWDRQDLYAATLRLIADHPLRGAGANMFFPLFETIKPDSLRGADYYYAHWDYLQVWLEFGVVGLVLLVLLVASSLLLALRSAQRLPGEPVSLVCGAALTTCFAHAMVDFPLYVPFLLVLTGAFLGALSSACGRPLLSAATRLSLARAGARMTPAIRGALMLAALAWLSQPMVAEIAVHRSLALLARGETRDALYWQSVAQRFEPRHPAHYWAEAMIWREQLALTRNPLFAAEADAAYLRGIRASPYDVANLLGRAQLHRRFAGELRNPASPQEILAWTKHAAELRPQHGGVQAEYARALAHAGKQEEARALAHLLAVQFPRSESVRRLAREP